MIKMKFSSLKSCLAIKSVLLKHWNIVYCPGMVKLVQACLCIGCHMKMWIWKTRIHISYRSPDVEGKVVLWSNERKNQLRQIIHLTWKFRIKLNPSIRNVLVMMEQSITCTIEHPWGYLVYTHSSFIQSFSGSPISLVCLLFLVYANNFFGQ